MNKQIITEEPYNEEIINFIFNLNLDSDHIDDMKTYIESMVSLNFPQQNKAKKAVLKGFKPLKKIF